MRNVGTGRKARPVPFFSGLLSAATALALAGMASSASAATPVAVSLAGAASSSSAINDFYRARGARPLWLAQGSGAAAQHLLGLLESAEIDGLDPDRYQVRKLSNVMRSAWGGDRRAVERAEKMLSEAFVAYARDLRRAPDIGMIYVDRELAPTPWPARQLLDKAATAPSLESFIDGMGWMNPAYAPLRRALATRAYSSDDQRRILALNLERARALPSGFGRFVLVNAAAQRLFVYENGEVVDSMRVVVGKPKYPTPMMSAFIRGAALNPYWNVPPDLTAERIAPNVVKQGVRYLKSLGYEVLSDWGDDPSVVDPTTIDWHAVADGRTEIRVRQLPGPHNALGAMKFVFPNAQGIFLHDTPDRQLLSEASRLYSGGCIRLEDAARLGRRLFGRDLKKQGDAPEQMVPIPALVPLYVTYLTAVPSGTSIAYFDDVYGRDAARLAQLGGDRLTSGSSAAGQAR